MLIDDATFCWNLCKEKETIQNNADFYVYQFVKISAAI